MFSEKHCSSKTFNETYFSSGKELLPLRIIQFARLDGFTATPITTTVRF